MFTVLLFFIVPLFLYCSYLFYKDIKSSYFMHSFRRQRLKTGNNHKAWKPVSLQELKMADEKVKSTEPLGTQPLNRGSIDDKNENITVVPEKPVIKLYKDVPSNNEKVIAIESSFYEDNLLISIAKEMSTYDHEMRTLLRSYHFRMENYLAKLTNVVLMSDDKRTFIYPLERSTGTTMICYVVTEFGVNEKAIEIAELVSYKIIPKDESIEIQTILDEYINIKKGIKGYISKLRMNDVLLLQKSSRIVSVLPAAT